MRWLIAFLFDTVTRLSERTGFFKNEIILNAEVPNVVIQPHAWRRLKAVPNERRVPFVCQSLWAAKCILNFYQSSEFAFPRYNKTSYTDANLASAALNKWLKA